MFAVEKRMACLPADRLQFTLYLERLARETSSVSAVEEVFNAVNWVHSIAGLEPPSSDGIVRSVMEGVRRMYARPVVKKEPFKDLRAIVESFNLSDLSDVRSTAMCLLSFAGFLRFDELAGLHCSDVVFEDRHLKLKIRRSKTDQYRQGNEVVIAEVGGVTCPVQMLRNYVRLGEIDLSSEAALFRRITRTKGGSKLRAVGGISYTRVRELVREAICRVGLAPEKYGVHSLRAGGATAAANAGVPDRAFKRHGRWKSENAKDGYVKDTLEYKLNVTKSLGF